MSWEYLRERALGLGVEGLASMIDHTVLRPGTTTRDVERVVSEAERYGFACAVVPPVYVGHAASISSARICTVIGFPLGYHPPRAKLAELEHAIDEGASEVDIVMNVALFKAGAKDAVLGEARSLVERAHESGVVAKIIIETSLLSDEEIVDASRLVEEAGADYVKTNTGFGKRGVTVRDVILIRRALGPGIGIKAAGGIRTAIDALLLVEAGANRLGTSTGPAIIEDMRRLLGE